MQHERRPRLTPAIADVRRAVREALPTVSRHDDRSDPLVLVGLSGGADSLALAAATAFEGPRAGIRVGAVIVDHGIQAGSAQVAERAAAQARALGIDRVLVKTVTVDPGAGGPEAGARTKRYAAFAQALAETGAEYVLLAHTLDDQAETVLLGLARGSGPVSLHGMDRLSGRYLRPLLGVRRSTTRQFCVDSRLQHWDDPQNLDPAFTRVRVRETVLPILEKELGPGVAEALARTAQQLREDTDALDGLALEWARELTAQEPDGSIALDVRGLESDPAALRQRIIRLVVGNEFGVWLHRVHTVAVAGLITDWHGQKALALPGVTVVRQGGRLIFRPATTINPVSKATTR
ncbi:MAG: tRNA lysidine(34) synthetase TilS [Microbacteriaceae bacterium]